MYVFKTILSLLVIFITCFWTSYAESEEPWLSSIGVSLPEGATNKIELELSYYPNMVTPGKQPVYGGIINLGEERQYASLSVNLFAIPMKPEFCHDYFIERFWQYLIPNFEVGVINNSVEKDFGLHTGIWFVNIVCPFVHLDFFEEETSITFGIDIKIPLSEYLQT